MPQAVGIDCWRTQSGGRISEVLPFGDMHMKKAVEVM